MPKKRWQILADVLSTKQHTVGAEIGVFKGITSAFLLANLPSLKLLYCVDSWQHYPEHTATLNPKKPRFHDANFAEVRHTFEQAIRPWRKKVRVLDQFSVLAAGQVGDKTLDWVFIDANHAYEYVRQDILLWAPKVKDGGIIAGHDYHVRGWNGSFGVTMAVEELLGYRFDFKRHVWWHTMTTDSPLRARWEQPVPPLAATELMEENQ